MSEVWVQAIEIIHLEKGGVTKTLHKGDWGTTSRGHARDLLARGAARILSPGILRDIQELNDCAIYLRGTVLDSSQSRLAVQYPGVPILPWSGFPSANVGRFLLWDMSAPLRQELIVVGLGLLSKWQIACPLLSYDTLAQNIGTEVERIETRAVIHDLRVPVYNPKVIFARQGEETKRLFELWNSGGELSFLRALYQARPIVNALPPSWVL